MTAFAHGPRHAEDVLKEVGGAPCVIKLLEGTQGRGVILAETTASAKSIIEAFSAANMNILVQEFIKEAGGNDIRALVVGCTVVASMLRSGKMGDFRANLHRGGKADAVVISEDERRAVRRRGSRQQRSRGDCCLNAAAGDRGQLLAARGQDRTRRGRGRAMIGSW